MPQSELPQGLKPFAIFGLHFTPEKKAGDNYFTLCPFSAKENKFFVNHTNGLWDSKTTGRSGNVVEFVRQVYEVFLSLTTPDQLQTLAESRGVTLKAFEGIAYNPFNNSYLIPTRNQDGKIINVGKYTIGSKGIFNVPSLPVGLYNYDKLFSDERLLPVSICEGQWDALCLEYAYKATGVEKIVLAVPGATTFKKEWVQAFQGREVDVLFDNDDPGIQGTEKVKTMLEPYAESMRFLGWPDEFVTGADIRDICVAAGEGLFTKTKIDFVLAWVDRHLSKRTVAAVKRTEAYTPPPPSMPPPKPEEIEKKLRMYLQVRDHNELDLVLGLLLANQIPQGEPVWAFLVGPPSGLKTEYINMISSNYFVETLSTLTPASLISGFFSSTPAGDESLIPKLNGRFLAIKDLTALLTSNPNTRDEVFGILRDSFDGYIEKAFARGKKSFHSKYGLLGAVTNVVDGYTGLMSQLGERFLKIRVNTPSDTEEELDICFTAMRTLVDPPSARKEVQQLVNALLYKPIPETLPDFTSQEDRRAVASMAIFIARLRATIMKDTRTQEQLTLPFSELGPRCARMLTKWAIGICRYRDHANIGEHEMNLLRRVARDSCPDRVEAIVRAMYCKGESMQQQEFIELTKLSPGTVSRVLTDLVSMRLLDRSSGATINSYSYTLHGSLKSLITDSGVYKDLTVYEKPVAPPPITPVRKRLRFTA